MPMSAYNVNTAAMVQNSSRQIGNPQSCKRPMFAVSLSALKASGAVSRIDPCPTRGGQGRTRRHANQTVARRPLGAPRQLVALPAAVCPIGRVCRIAERRPDINSTTRVENDMIRFAIAMFLLLLFGIAVEELAGRSAGEPDASTDVVQAAQ